MRVQDLLIYKFCITCSLVRTAKSPYEPFHLMYAQIQPYLSFFFLVDWPPRPRSMLIIGWWSSNPRTEAAKIARLCPSLFRIMFHFFLSSDNGYDPLSSLQDSPGFLAYQCTLTVHTLYLLPLPPPCPFFIYFSVHLQQRQFLPAFRPSEVYNLPTDC